MVIILAILERRRSIFTEELEVDDDVEAVVAIDSLTIGSDTMRKFSIQ